MFFSDLEEEKIGFSKVSVPIAPDCVGYITLVLRTLIPRSRVIEKLLVS
jgi:hypothetical protein